MKNLIRSDKMFAEAKEAYESYECRLRHWKNNLDSKEYKIAMDKCFDKGISLMEEISSRIGISFEDVLAEVRK